MLNVLLSSAGRRVALLQAFREDLCQLGVEGQLLAADVSRLAPAGRFADRSLLVPRCTTAEFVPAMLDLCRRHEVALVVPTIDTELPAYASARDDFAAAGTTVLVSSPEVVGIAADKVLTHRWLVESGLPTVAQTTVEQVLADPRSWPLPLVVKPRRGSASVGVTVVEDAAHLRAAAAGEVVVQAVAPGLEYTVDVLVDRTGTVVSAVPRLRLEVRAGEISKGVTAGCQPVIDVAHLACQRLPGAYGPITVQVFHDARSGAVNVIEVNARFGGGYPLSWRAGARYPQRVLEELLGRTSLSSLVWRERLVMLRYDEAVFVDAAEVGL